MAACSGNARSALHPAGGTRVEEPGVEHAAREAAVGRRIDVAGTFAHRLHDALAELHGEGVDGERVVATVSRAVGIAGQRPFGLDAEFLLHCAEGVDDIAEAGVSGFGPAFDDTTAGEVTEGNGAPAAPGGGTGIAVAGQGRRSQGNQSGRGEKRTCQHGVILSFLRSGECAGITRRDCPNDRASLDVKKVKSFPDTPPY